MIKSFVKKCTLLACSLLLTGAVSAENSFSSFAGAAADFNVLQNGTLTVEGRGVFAGQYAIDNKVIFRGDFVINTDDILSGGLFQDTSARFTINEASLSYRFVGNSILQQVSGFIGRQESQGSDLFVKRYFGIRNFSSDFLSPQLYYAMPGIYSYEGAGLSYVIKMAKPTAFGFYATYDKDLIKEATATTKAEYAPHINLDLRYAFAWDWGALDSGIGVILPIERVDTAGADVIMMLRKVELRTGLATLLEVTGTTSIFLQAGVIKVQVAPPDNAFNITFDDLYLFLEPRFITSYFTYATSFFCLPQEALKNCVYARNPIGFNIMAKSGNFLLAGHTARGGAHFAVSANSLTEPEKNYDVQITPFIDYSFLSGRLSAFAQIRPAMYQNPAEFINVSIGYKTTL
ncbi:MAG: hypothetical protein MJ178_04975 [Treponemataceae bacterium]|nr:hypothetical protein [Treponemataceae bacterium]